MLSLIKSKIIKLYQFISYQGLDDSDTNRDKDFMIMINQYLFLLFVIFLFQGFVTYLYIGLEADVLFLGVTSLACLLCSFFFKNFIKNKYFILAIFFYLTLVVTYYASITSVESGCYIYYFSILTAIPIFFSVKKDTAFVVSIFLFVVLCLYVSAFKNFQLWGVEAQFSHQGLEHGFLIINLTCKLLLLVVNYFFLEEKRNDYYKALHRNTLKREKIDHLNTEIKALRELFNTEELSDENFKDLLIAISLNDVVFLEKFQRIFPYFKKNLFDNTGVSLSTSELTLCAIMKLGLTTKEISIHTNASLKAIEGRKYRLRKKLNIPSDIDFTLWFSNF
ncbi:hypothetical protein AB670_03913 [Chryseobacterium sp. MOF25P]|uniref:helix-turn-helix transcriptional regulator n=1 Tax=unclassified Chryseobacterium TaxID=2593645 RepID=UPI000805EE1D|nr:MULTISPECIES: hypothetical protein [unclassified Chryseobacterium]OBW39739.1 hypothetical protein AB670_03913 [Chryseobacterium sp. MOF25P]OBW45170.1 hypothetical protein AB671_02729 [Chryseobacterium sp. BGARF1]